MSLTGWLTDRVKNLLTEPLDEMNSWARFVRVQIQLWRHCARRLYTNNAMAMSAALSFRTIFTIVPILVLAFLILKSVGSVDQSKVILRDFLNEAGLAEISYQEPPQTAPGAATAPATDGQIDQSTPRTISVADQIEVLVESTEKKLTLGSLGPVGAVLFVWTAITLLTTIERSLNRIFEAPRPRALVRRVFLYWSALTLGPLLIVGCSVGLERVAAMAQSLPAFATAISTVKWAAAFLFGVMVVAILYSQLPNTEVLWRSALTGAVITVLLWLVGQWGFTQYIQMVASKSIYGALGLVPLFLMWLNLFWWVFLFGAQLAHSVSHLGRLSREDRPERINLGPWDYLGCLLAVARWQASQASSIRQDDIADALNMRGQDAERLIRQLCDAGLICRIADERKKVYVLVRPANRISIKDVLCLGEKKLTGAQGDRDIAEKVAGVRNLVDSGVENITIDQIIQSQLQPSESDANEELA